MSQETERVKIDIFGHLYTVRAQTSPEQVERLARIVDEKMNELFEQNPRLDLSTLAVLTALNLAEAYDAVLTEYKALLDALEIEARHELSQDSES